MPESRQIAWEREREFPVFEMISKKTFVVGVPFVTLVAVGLAFFLTQGSWGIAGAAALSFWVVLGAVVVFLFSPALVKRHSNINYGSDEIVAYFVLSALAVALTAANIDAFSSAPTHVGFMVLAISIVALVYTYVTTGDQNSPDFPAELVVPLLCGPLAMLSGFSFVSRGDISAGVGCYCVFVLIQAVYVYFKA